jgi:hypothetical protein
MNTQQFPEYEVMPDITNQNNIKYWVVHVQARNEEGNITAFEKVGESRDHDEAQRIAQRLNDLP